MRNWQGLNYKWSVGLNRHWLQLVGCLALQCHYAEEMGIEILIIFCLTRGKNTVFVFYDSYWDCNIGLVLRQKLWCKITGSIFTTFPLGNKWFNLPYWQGVHVQIWLVADLGVAPDIWISNAFKKQLQEAHILNWNTGCPHKTQMVAVCVWWQLSISSINWAFTSSHGKWKDSYIGLLYYYQGNYPKDRAFGMKLHLWVIFLHYAN